MQVAFSRKQYFSKRNNATMMTMIITMTIRMRMTVVLLTEIMMVHC